MITSEAGKALIQTCLAKDEPIVESPSTMTILNKIDEISTKRVKLNPSDEIKQLPLSCLINSNPQQQSIHDPTDLGNFPYQPS
jgi:hypothetical protein